MARLPAGTAIGRYTVVGLLGSGAMGDVYRARDPRLGRDVAIKVVLASVYADSDSRHRFEQEARATGMLNHPNIMSIYDVGIWEGMPYVVTEFLEGKTLRQAMAGGRLPPRRAIDYAISIARGLEAAHRKQIIHRDLKPENVFVTNDGCVKILDFGLAKLTARRWNGEQGETAVQSSLTEPGMLLGTIAYMSPEQVRCEAADESSDIFTLGVVLYEMVAGRRPFERESPADTLAAILHDDPPPLSDVAPGVLAALDGVVRRCLEKRRQDRFQSAHDLALALEAIHLSTQRKLSAHLMFRPPSRNVRRYGAVAALATALAAVTYVSTSTFDIATAPNIPAVDEPTFQRLTFRRGWVSAARFAPEGRTVVYSAAWDAGPPEVFLVRSEHPESRPLSLADADLLAVSSNGELALLRHPLLTLNIYHRRGTLARASLGGGAPRDLLDDIRFADWAPGGSQLIAVRDVGDERRIEYPLGHALYETPNAQSNTIVSPRVSPGGEYVAFFEGFGARVSRWSVNIVDRAGVKKTLSPDWFDWWRLAWGPSGKEVWFAASKAGSSSALYATDLEGSIRRLLHLPGTLELHDVARDGRVLLALIDYRTFTRGIDPTGQERDLSWLDASAAVALSHDGSMVVLDEHGEGGGETNAAYIRPTDGSPAIRLGAGRPLALSPDNKWVLATHPGPPLQLFLLPTGAGEMRTLDPNGFDYVRAASWFPDGKRIVLAAAEPGRGLRLYVQPLDDVAQAVSSERYDLIGDAVSPDGKQVVAMNAGDQPVILSLRDGTKRPITGLSPREVPVAWIADGSGLYVASRCELPAKLYRLDLASGRKQLVRSLMPPDAAGVGVIASVLVSGDARVTVYSYEQTLSDLFLVEGLK